MLAIVEASTSTLNPNTLAFRHAWAPLLGALDALLLRGLPAFAVEQGQG